MTSPFQIAANRINAKRSTGPKTANGKRASSGNARRHGLTAALTPDEVRAAYFRITGQGLPLDAALGDAKALQLAKAEVRLCRARSYECAVLAEGDDAIRLHPEMEMVDDVIADALEGTIRPSRQATDMIRFRQDLTDQSRQIALDVHRRSRRFLRQAEREYDRALSAWVRS